MAILLFVGCDKTGKTTLIKEVLKKTNKHICVDRFTACQHVYGVLHNKLDTPSTQELWELEKFMINSPIKTGIIYVTANTKDIMLRFVEHNERDIEIDQIEKVKRAYSNYLNHSPLEVCMVNTSARSVNGCVQAVLNFAEFLDERSKICEKLFK